MRFNLCLKSSPASDTLFVQNHGEVLPPWRSQRHRDILETRPNPCQGKILKKETEYATSYDVAFLLQSKYGGFAEVWAGSYNTVAVAKSGEVTFAHTVESWVNISLW